MTLNALWLPIKVNDGSILYIYINSTGAHPYVIQLKFSVILVYQIILKILFFIIIIIITLKIPNMRHTYLVSGTASI